MKIAFVILHYLTFNDTSECVDSILKNIDDENDLFIVIVDNGSNNGSRDMLHNNYDSDNRIHIIDSEINLGFSKGNNLGYIYAKEKLQADFIIMINNDTIIKQKNFISKIVEIYNSQGYDILGPDIISLIDNKHQNPYHSKLKKFNKKALRCFMLRRYKDILITFLGLDLLMLKVYKMYFQKLYRKYLKSYKERKRKVDVYNSVQANVKLHGSCLIFSPNYVRKYNGLYSNIFMYMEEDILFYIAIKENLKLLYDPQVKIFHKEDSATNVLLNSNKNKKLFVYKNEIKSAKELMKIIKNNNIYKQDIISKKFN